MIPRDFPRDGYCSMAAWILILISSVKNFPQDTGPSRGKILPRTIPGANITQDNPGGNHYPGPSRGKTLPRPSWGKTLPRTIPGETITRDHLGEFHLWQSHMVGICRSLGLGLRPMTSRDRPTSWWTWKLHKDISSGDSLRLKQYYTVC